MFYGRNSAPVTVSLAPGTVHSQGRDLEASALSHASRRGLLARRSPLLKLQGDEKLIAMVRSGNPGAFETIVDRYQARLLGFCRQMLGSTEDAEDVLQEVFVNAYRAMLADDREINLRPWLYRIARNRCLNHLRKPKADAQESMDMVPEVEAASTAEKVHNREEFRQILTTSTSFPRRSARPCCCARWTPSPTRRSPPRWTPPCLRSSRCWCGRGSRSPRPARPAC